MKKISILMLTLSCSLHAMDLKAIEQVKQNIAATIANLVEDPLATPNATAQELDALTILYSTQLNTIDATDATSRDALLDSMATIKPLLISSYEAMLKAYAEQHKERIAKFTPPPSLPEYPSTLDEIVLELYRERYEREKEIREDAARVNEGVHNIVKEVLERILGAKKIIAGKEVAPLPESQFRSDIVGRFSAYSLDQE